MSKHGTMATDRPDRYAKQLAGHWAAKATVTEDGAVRTLVMGNGQTVVLRPVEGALEVEASVPADGDLDRWAQVVADHLQRFGQRDELEVVWA
ncbi:DUF2218 domain-containing protein [Nocardioides sp. P5_C9_2]